MTWKALTTVLPSAIQIVVHAQTYAKKLTTSAFTTATTAQIYALQVSTTITADLLESEKLGHFKIFLVIFLFDADHKMGL